MRPSAWNTMYVYNYTVNLEILRVSPKPLILTLIEMEGTIALHTINSMHTYKLQRTGNQAATYVSWDLT